MFLTSDPITAAQNADNNLGALAVTVSCNDIAAAGAEPVAVLLTMLLPPTTGAETAGIIVKQAEAAAKAVNVDIVGGHTEFTDAVIRPVVVATAAGISDKILSARGAKTGDAIIMTKYAGIEGTMILSNDYREKLALNDAEYQEAAGLINMLSVVPEGRLCAQIPEVTAMHDITEGGVLGAIDEICFSGNLGAEVYADKMPVLPLTDKICKKLSLDPYRLISSGSMLITARAPEKVLKILAENNISATAIGKVIDL